MATVIEDVRPKHRFSVGDYHRMGEAGVLGEDDRVELIEGEIIDMAPIGSRHAGTVRMLAERMSSLIGDRAMLSAQSPVVLSERSEPEPDLALLRRRSDFYRASHPRAADTLLLVEVADTTLRFDLELKVALYARSGVPEVWVVDLENDVLHVFRSPGPGGYAEHLDLSGPAILSPERLPDVRIDLTGLFAPAA